MNETDLGLPMPTNRTSQGPRIVHANGKSIVEYDYEADNGESRWAEIAFTETLFLQFADSACDVEVLDADMIRRVGESPLLYTVMARWNERVGWQKWQQGKGGAGRFLHYTVFFDDAGSLDVIASDCKVSIR